MGSDDRSERIYLKNIILLSSGGALVTDGIESGRTGEKETQRRGVSNHNLGVSIARDAVPDTRNAS